MIRLRRLVLVSVIVLIRLTELVHTRRLSFKESLTAYAETEEDQEVEKPVIKYYKASRIPPELVLKEDENERVKIESGYILPGFGTLIPKNDGNIPISKSKFSVESIVKNNSANGIFGSIRSPIPIRRETPAPVSTTGKGFSLWEITKNMLHSLQQKGSKRFITGNSGAATTQSAENNSRSVNFGDASSSAVVGAAAAIATGTSSDSSHFQSEKEVLRFPTKEMPKQQAWDNFLTTMKNEQGSKIGNSYDNNKNNAAANNNTLNTTKLVLHLKDLEEQYRKKKEAGNNAGLRDLMWNTARALWSVNKESLIPTFLHTKTGGKLSLIRDSIFKPLNILNQFKSGVQEINNEKWKNLARLSAAGTGWSSPEVILVKVQPQNSRLLHLVKYIIRLSKHTVITKWRLKRYLLDLQFRILKKIFRIIKSKNIGQKIAILKILGSSAINGKRQLLRIITGALRKKANLVTGVSKPSYSGKDNSINVDLTYSSLHKDYGWANSGSSAYSAPPPPPPPQDSYHPLATPTQSTLHTNYYYDPENTPSIPLLPPPPSLSYEQPPPEQRLIETPSYASLLKVMGISLTSTTTKAPPASIYYYPSSISSTSTNSPYSSNSYKIPLIEKPAASYSYYPKPSSNSNYQNSYQNYNLFSSADSSSSFVSSLLPDKTHNSNNASIDTAAGSNDDENDIITASSSSSSSYPSSPSSPSQFFITGSGKTSTVNNNVITTMATSTTTPSPFRLKLLEYMGRGASAIS